MPEGNAPVYCSPYRQTIPMLTYQIQNMTGLEAELITKVLTRDNEQPKQLTSKAYSNLGVNHPDDKYKLSPKEHKAGFKADTSISEAEAYRFIYQVLRFGRYEMKDDPMAKIARALKQIYFGDHPLYEKKDGSTPNGMPPHEYSAMKVWGECYDADTCTVSIDVPKQCFDLGLLGYYGPLRESQVDSPEWGDILKYKVVPDTAFDWVMNEFTKAGKKVPKPSGTKPKLIENAIKIFRSEVKKQDYSPAEVFRAIQLIATWISYSADIDKAVMNDFEKYVRAKGGKLFSKEATLRYLSEDTPPHMCGLWVPYDVYLRRLGSIYVDRQELILGYLVEGMPVTMKRMTETYYKAYKELIGEYAAPLAESKNEGIKALADTLSPTKLITPQTMYSDDKREKMLKGLVELTTQYPAFLTCWSLAKVLLGLDIDYKKYRGPDYPVYEKAGDMARKNGFGSWKYNPPFKMLYDHNMKDPRYHPVDCLTGQE